MGMYMFMCTVEAREQPWMLFLGFVPFPFVLESFPGLELTRWARLKVSKLQESLAIPLHHRLSPCLTLLFEMFWGWVELRSLSLQSKHFAT